MAGEETKSWEQQVRDAAARAEEELQRALTFINDEVVPDIRRNGAQALRAAAAELRKLAQQMERHAAASPPPAPGESRDKDKA